LAQGRSGKPRTFDTEQKKRRNAVKRLANVAMAHIMPYCNEVSGEVKLDTLGTKVDMLELAFGEQEKAAMAKGELLKLKLRDGEFIQYCAEMQRYVADVE
jgi:hypothetical protein